MATGFSLWLMPDVATAGAAAALVERLAPAHAGVLFEPHVTLLGDIFPPSVESLEATASAIAAATPPIAVSFSRAATGGVYYRCVFALVGPIPPALAAANSAAQAACGHDEVFMPHMSLLYSDIPQDEREAVAAAVADAVAALPPATLGRLELWDTTGRPPTWKLVRAWDLTGKDAAAAGGGGVA
jgi:hypothetical protein